mgnify:CR=1 FL=1
MRRLVKPRPTRPRPFSKAKKALETILEGINKYPSVELRWRMSGQGKAQFEAMLKDVKDKMRKKSSSGGSGGSGGAGGMR